MASTIRGSDNFDSADALQTTGLATAWVNFDGTGVVTIRDQYNVTSITDGGVGIYNLNLTNALDNVNFVVSGCTGSQGGTSYIGILGKPGSSTTSSIEVRIQASSSALFDSTYAQFIIHGGKN